MAEAIARTMNDDSAAYVFEEEWNLIQRIQRLRVGKFL